MAVRELILDRAPGVLARSARPTVADFATAAGVSRASFYRHFRSREALLEALEVVPEPGSRERILRAAVEMVGDQGLGALAMDELADRAGVSRATLYRVFPGKAAMFTGLIESYSPLEPVSRLLAAEQDAAPLELMPELARTAYRAVYTDGGRIFEIHKPLLLDGKDVGSIRVGVSTLLIQDDLNKSLRPSLIAVVIAVAGASLVALLLAPETEEAARGAITKVVGALVMYVTSQMSAGTLRTMHPLLALQLFIGPIFFHILTRPFAERVLSLDIDGETAVTQLAESWLRAMVVKEEGDG